MQAGRGRRVRQAVRDMQVSKAWQADRQGEAIRKAGRQGEAGRQSRKADSPAERGRQGEECCFGEALWARQAGRQAGRVK